MLIYGDHRRDRVHAEQVENLSEIAAEIPWSLRNVIVRGADTADHRFLQFTPLESEAQSNNRGDTGSKRLDNLVGTLGGVVAEYVDRQAQHGDE